MHSWNVDTIKQVFSIIFSAPSSKNFLIYSVEMDVNTHNRAWARESQCQTWYILINNSGVSSFIYYLLFIWVLKCSLVISHTCVSVAVHCCRGLKILKWKEKKIRTHTTRMHTHISGEFPTNLSINSRDMGGIGIAGNTIHPPSPHPNVAIVKNNPLNYYTAFNSPRAHS